jgi:hypothetical protein
MLQLKDSVASVKGYVTTITIGKLALQIFSNRLTKEITGSATVELEVLGHSQEQQPKCGQ